MLLVVAYEAMEEFDKAQKDQHRLQDEMEVSCESVLHEVSIANLNGAFREVSDCWARHEVTCVGLTEACLMTGELKRKAADARERTRSHRERCRRATKEHTKSEAAINHNLGRSGLCAKETANATLSDLRGA